MSEQDTATFDQSVREAALAAMESQGLGEDSWPSGEDDDSEAAEQEAPDIEDSEDEAATSDEEESDEETEEVSEEDVPTEWFGVDLSALPAEQRKQVIDHYKEQDRYAQSLAQKLAATEKGERPAEAAQQPPEEAPTEPLDDDQILALLGIDSDDPMYEVKKEIMAPLGRVIAEQQAALNQIQERDQEAQFIQWWDSGVTEMEEQFGPLSISRDELAQIALKEGLRSPQEAYARVALSGRKTVEDLVSKAKEGAKKKAKAKPPATQRPRTDSAASRGEKKLMSPKEAALAAAKASGLDWTEALKNTP